MTLMIRGEAPDDLEFIDQLTRAAFDRDDEANRLNRLRDDGDLVLSLVAAHKERILGHVAFSPVFLDGVFRNWLGLGPISVWPNHQSTGIGSALITEGLARLRQQKISGCILIGNPKYYSRFGFIGDEAISYRDFPIGIAQWISLSDETPSGVLTYSPGLELADV